MSATSPCGKWLKAKVPRRRWKTVTFLAASRHDRIEAPWLIDGPTSGERFRLYVERKAAKRTVDTVTSDECGNYFAHAGCDLT